MRFGGAEGPQNGALVNISQRRNVEREIAESSIYNTSKKPIHQANVNFLVVNQAVSSKNASNSVKQYQGKNNTKLERNLLITLTGNNKHNNNNNSNNNNNKRNNNNSNKKTCNITHSFIDEIRYKKLKKQKQNPETTTTTTTNRPKTTRATSIKQQKSGRLGMLISFIITGFATLKTEIMRVLHVQKSLEIVARTATTGGAGGGGSSVAMNIQQRSTASVVGCLVTLALLLLLLPCGVVHGDDGDHFFGVNSFSMGLETTTPEFDYASRGQKKFGDKCDNTLECGFPGSLCDPKKKYCLCTEDLPITNHIDKCGKEAAINESCFFHEQCESKYFQTECRDGKCVCRFEMTPVWGKDGSVECKGRQDKRGPETYIDPAMIGVLVGMALMFIIICVVLRLFSQARWRENRTIFNTPNPRLMNVSLLRDSKLIHGQERRGSRMSMRGPSRQPSMASLRPHSPNPSLGKTGARSDSNGSASNASATSIRSNSVAPGNVHSSHHERHGSAHYQHQHQKHNPEEHVTHITTNPVAESVTVEIMTPYK